MSTVWQFQLKSSFLKLLIQCAVLSSMSLLAAQMMAMYWVALLLALMIIISFFTRDKQPIVAFSQLDQDIWTVAWRQKSVRHIKQQPKSRKLAKTSTISKPILTTNTQNAFQQYRLVQVTGLGWCCWLTFQALHADTKLPKTCTICVMIDQMTASEWRKLMQLKNFY